MKSNPYPRYKSIEAEWLVRLPSHWTIEPLGRTACIRSSNVDKHIRANEIPVRLCNYVDVYHNDHIDSTLNYMSGTATEDQIARLSLREGDVVITKDSEVADDIGVPSLVSGDAPDSLVAAYHLTVLRPDATKLVGSYLLRALQSDVASHQFSLGARGVTRYALSYSTIKSVRLPCPPLLEQQAIVAFLDHILAKIDTLVEKILSLIEHFQEYRRALITEIVTRGLPPDENQKMGLDPCPKLISSRVEWLGDVPKHWNIARLKYLATVNDEQLSEATDPTLELTYIDIGSVDPDRGIVSSKRIVFEDAPTRARRIVRAGDTIVSTVRTYLRAILTLRSPKEGTIVSTGFAVLRPNKTLSPEFLGYVACSPRFVEAVCSRSVGVSYPATNASEIGTIAVAHPDRKEQQAIASFLDDETAKIDALIDKSRTLIERLREKRQALITAAVTGQIDVREEGEDATE